MVLASVIVWAGGLHDMRSRVVDITGSKEMYSVSVNHSEVLRSLVVDIHWKYGV